MAGAGSLEHGLPEPPQEAVTAPAVQEGGAENIPVPAACWEWWQSGCYGPQEACAVL